MEMDKGHLGGGGGQIANLMAIQYSMAKCQSCYGNGSDQNNVQYTHYANVG